MSNYEWEELPLITFKTVRLSDNTEVCLGNHENGNKSNFGYINSDRVYVFDSGYSSDFFNEYIARLVSLGKKIVVVLSHHHSDHINGIWRIENNRNVSIICSSSTVEKMKTNVNNITICKEDLWLNEHIFVRRCVNCHTNEDLILEDANKKVVFMGDMLLDCHHPYINNTDVNQWINYLEVFKKKKFDYYIPGHGECMSINTIEKYISYLKVWMQTVQMDEFKKTYNERIEIFLNHTNSFSWKQRENIRKNFENIQEKICMK